MIVAAIDPGLNGAVAVLSEDGELDTMILPTTGEKTKRRINTTRLADYLTECDVEYAIIELVHAMPKQGVSSSFRFGMAFGQVAGVVGALAIPHDYVTPQKWKQHFGLGSDKEASRQKAIQLFPRFAQQFDRRKDEGRAEAALMALYFISTEG